MTGTGQNVIEVVNQMVKLSWFATTGHDVSLGESAGFDLEQGAEKISGDVTCRCFSTLLEQSAFFGVSSVGLLTLCRAKPSKFTIAYDGSFFVESDEAAVTSGSSTSCRQNVDERLSCGQNVTSFDGLT